MTAGELPPQVASALEPGEAVEAAFEMDGRLEIYATPRRLLCKRGDLMTALGYEAIKDLRHRAPIGIPQIAMGLGFLAAGAIMGFGDTRAAVAAALLMAIGGGFLLLATFRKGAQVEFRLESRESARSLALSALLFPFLLLLRPGKRYQVRGEAATVEAFYRFVGKRLPGPGPTRSAP